MHLGVPISLVFRILVQVGIKVQVVKISKIDKSAGWDEAVPVGILEILCITINHGFCFRILKFNKSAGLKISKIIRFAANLFGRQYIHNPKKNKI